MRKHNVVLIGGTSHAGKTTVARALSSRCDCDLRSSDKLARHPGRPWAGARGEPVPEHVEEHYSSLNADELLVDVLNHYKINVVPQVRGIVQQFESGQRNGCAIIEGSALWPEFVGDLARRPSVAAIWLVTSDRVLQERIYAESDYANADARQKHLIDNFLQRTLLYSDGMKRSLEELGLPSITIDDESPALLLNALIASIEADH